MRSTMRFLPGSLLVTVAAVVVLTFAGPVALANSTPGTLTFTVQPTTSQVGTVMSVVVEDLDSTGSPIGSFNGAVILSCVAGTTVLSACPPTGSTVNARKGIATFSLTFNAVGFEFQLQASGQGATTSNASSQFDIVTQLVHCQQGKACQTETVSSAGTSGFAAAGTASTSDVLAATGGGFPALSCTSSFLGGGVLTFTATNRSKTITIMLPKNLVQQNQPPGSSHFNICWGSATSFTTADGTTSAFNSANNEFEGLVANCPLPPGSLPSSPCIASQNKTGAGVEVATISVPPGDGHITW